MTDPLHDKVSAVRDAVSFFSRPRANLTQEQTITAIRLASHLADATKERVYKYVHDFPLEPLLFQYVNDGWLAFVHEHKNLVMCGKNNRISTRRRVEFCLVRANCAIVPQSLSRRSLYDVWRASSYARWETGDELCFCHGRLLYPSTVSWTSRHTCIST